MDNNIWTPESEEFVIELVRLNPCLWKPSDLQYKARHLKRKVYEDIAANLKECFPNFAAVTADMVLSKFASLKAYYLKQKREEIKVKSGSGADIFTSKWRHYVRFSFLSEGLEALHSVSNLDEFHPSTSQLSFSQASPCSSQVPASVSQHPTEIPASPVMSTIEEMNDDVAESSFAATATPSFPRRKRKRAVEKMPLSETAGLLVAATEALKIPDPVANEEDAFFQYLLMEFKNIKCWKRRQTLKSKYFNLMQEALHEEHAE